MREGGETTGAVPLGARRTASGRVPWSRRALDWFADRTLPELLAVWIGMVLAFAILYWLMDLSPGAGLRTGDVPVPGSWPGLLTAVYFSFVTATSVGYGDVVPVGVMRVAAIVEAMAGLVVFGLLVSKFVSRRQEQLIAEIHRITFEDRLGRVRTNLHMVIRELETIAATCEDRGWPHDRLETRVESAAMVFTGELRSIHDLLYRPQQLPEEAALEEILGELAAGLREFGRMLAHMPGHEARPAVLDRSLHAIAALAREICGECVPREYAPGLKAWMDRVQELAAALVT